MEETSRNRRKLIKSIGGIAAVGSIGSLLGCGTPSNSSSSSAPASSSSSSSSSVSSVSSSSVASSSSRPAVEGWARGGTAAMWADFPPANPMAGSTPTVCQPTSDLLLGPCYFDNGMREDISDGELGVPTVFAIQALDQSCRPISGLVVDIWHTNCEGFYSADDSSASERSPDWDGPFCANNDQTAMNSRWHRGAQISNNEGIAFFKSCFPGWYAGRTNHIHLRFVRNGQELLATQFGWDDALCNEIHVNHPEYIGRTQDTSMGSDIVFSGGGGFGGFGGFGGGGGGNTAQWHMDTRRLEDGSMLCSKSVILPV